METVAQGGKANLSRAGHRLGDLYPPGRMAVCPTDHQNLNWDYNQGFTVLILSSSCQNGTVIFIPGCSILFKMMAIPIIIKSINLNGKIPFYLFNSYKIWQLHNMAQSKEYAVSSSVWPRQYSDEILIKSLHFSGAQIPLEFENERLNYVIWSWETNKRDKTRKN